jgi:3alpha(or 20beta)-hydroxysteroid dehydrogenase
MGRLEGKVVIVTGAARGTGAATAEVLIEEGAGLVLGDVNAEGAAAQAKRLGERARSLALDVGDEGDWQRAVALAKDELGGVDGLVNNAAVLHLAALEDTQVADFERLVRVNQIGPFLGIRAVVPAMRERGRGAIVNVSSIDGISAKNGVVAYASTKWAVRGITRVAALELGRYGIRVNAVCPEAGSADMLAPYLPPGIDLEKILARQQPMLATQQGRTVADRVRDVAKMIAFLVSDDSASCTGTDFAVDGGNTAGRIVKGAPGS